MGGAGVDVVVSVYVVNVVVGVVLVVVVGFVDVDLVVDNEMVDEILLLDIVWVVDVVEAVEPMVLLIVELIVVFVGLAVDDDKGVFVDEMSGEEGALVDGIEVSIGVTF